MAMLDIRRPDGVSCPAYLAEGSSDDAPGVVVIQEWWGLNVQIKKTADRFAQAGYRALVPDLFRGKLAKSADEASHLMGHLNFLDAADQDIQGCVDFLRQSSPRVGVVGFCMGGALTLLSALRLEIDAGACFYGIPPKPVFDARRVSTPLILHFANTDDWCTPELVSGLKADLEQSGSRFELHRYDAEHAFMNEARPEVYEPESARLAWERTLGFFERWLKV
ncbi:MAG TPA: dienelactone hydrolase family protein [Polyangiaceae bacterium]|jgi:carboxymethylenebutenolidase|nr:dienelactone hydrolase family protein [Polyangiaceae bacterium]